MRELNLIRSGNREEALAANQWCLLKECILLENDLGV